MILGTALLVLAIGALLYTLYESVRDLLARGDVRRRERAVLGTWVSFSFVVAALVLLAGAFLVGDLSIAYVWRHVDIRYPWYQRLSGLWVGREGSLLLWTSFVLAFWALEEARHRRALRKGAAAAARAHWSAHLGAGAPGDVESRLADAEAIRRVARPVMIGLVAAMMLVVLVQRPFAAVDALDRMGQPFGQGVNPQLIILLNAIHPPIVFVGYALTAIPTAFAIAHLVTGRGGWLGPARRFAQLAFLFLTLGVGLGGLWAYIALGWGGYWAWDPVEVGSLVPWIATTAFLHAAYRADSHGEFAVAAPLLGLLTLPASLMSTFIVRAGGVWVSVHSFLAPGAADSAWQRFLSALATQPEVQLYTALLVLAALAFLTLTTVHVRRLEQREPINPAAAAAARKEAAPPRPLLQRLLAYIDLHHLYLVGVLLLTLLFTVTVTVLVVGINGFPSADVRQAVFEERTGPVALTAVLVMSAAIGLGVLRRPQVVGLLLGALALGGLAALFVFPEHAALAMATPLLVAAAVLAAARIALAWRSRNRHHALRFSGIHLIHLGVAGVLLGHGFVSTFDSQEEPVQLEPGESQSIGAYVLRLDDLDAHDTDDNGRLDHVVARIHIQRGTEDLGTVTTGFQYYETQAAPHYKPEVGVHRQLAQDLYFAPQSLYDPDQGWLHGNLPLLEQGGREALGVSAISVQLSTLPYINLVWGGALTMVLGALLLNGSTWTAPHHAARPAPAARPRPTPDAPDA